MGAAELKGVSELDFARAVRKHAEDAGWLVIETRKAGGYGRDGNWKAVADAGMPDFLLIRDRRAVALELKSETGRVSARQQEVCFALSKTPIETWIVRPRDSDFIVRTLT